ncbi:MAG: hypothetical protein NVSMB18_23570 [Acetobacteraceae bacterium]
MNGLGSMQGFDARSPSIWPGAVAGPAEGGRAELQQLRHLTKNALQRILSQVARHPDVRQKREGRALFRELERRILLTAAISDALFGLTREPGPFEERLRLLADSVIELFADPDQVVRFGLVLEGECPAGLHDLVLRVAHELIGNAVKHGMYARVAGRVDVLLRSGAAGTELLVTDDGWGWSEQAPAGQGLRVAQLIADERGGLVSLRRVREATVARLVIPAG